MDLIYSQKKNEKYAIMVIASKNQSPAPKKHWLF